MCCLETRWLGQKPWILSPGLLLYWPVEGEGVGGRLVYKKDGGDGWNCWIEYWPAKAKWQMKSGIFKGERRGYGSFEFDSCQKSRGSSPKRTNSIPSSQGRRLYWIYWIYWMELGEPSIEAGVAGVEEVTKVPTGGWWVYGPNCFRGAGMG